MIYDTLAHASLYENIHPSFAAAFAFLKEHAEDDLPVGRYEICDGVYAMVQQPNLLPAEQCKWEAHEKYIDIQFIKSGMEGISVAQTSDLTITVPYDAEKDCALYTGEGSLCEVKPGEFVVLWPHDAHMPVQQVKADGKSSTKIVVKIRV